MKAVVLRIGTTENLLGNGTAVPVGGPESSKVRESPQKVAILEP
jgi:hypothetical protein